MVVHIPRILFYSRVSRPLLCRLAGPLGVRGLAVFCIYRLPLRPVARLEQFLFITATHKLWLLPIQWYCHTPLALLEVVAKVGMGFGWLHLLMRVTYQIFRRPRLPLCNTVLLTPLHQLLKE